jgi:hypothetical protein
MGGACSSDGEGRGVCRVSVGKPDGKRLPERPRRRWEDNSLVKLQEMRYVGLNWIELAQDTARWRELVNVVMNFRVP